MREELIKIAIKNDGDYFKIKSDIEKGMQYLDVLIPDSVKIVTILDKRYPRQLLRLDKPPYVLFCLGNIDLLNKPSISVVGSRKNSIYGELICKQVVLESSKVIISGLAYGIDSIAHRQSLEQGNKTIAVLGSGVENIYPKEHIDLARQIAETGLLVSEYPPTVKPAKRNFPMRNRIIAGLSNELYVCEAKINSGTKITAEMALEIGNEIFCGYLAEEEASFSGTISLINDGANVISLKKPLTKGNLLTI